MARAPVSQHRDRPYVLTPGDPRSSVILHVPHAGTEIPAYVRAGLAVSDAELAAELAAMTDHHTDALAAAAADAATVRPWVFTNRLSRLVVDPERFPDDREPMRAVGMGAVYTRTSTGAVLRDDTHEGALLDTYFHPYAQAMAAAVQHRLDTTGACLIVDVHSYPLRPLPYEVAPSAPRPPLCVGVDDYHTPQWVQDAALAEFAGASVDGPFGGCYIPLAYYGRDTRVSGVMVETRRDTYLTEDGQVSLTAAARWALACAAVVDRYQGRAVGLSCA